MTFQPWKLCECCRTCVATCQGGDPSIALCTQCYLKLRQLQAEAGRMQELEEMWKLDGSWVKECQVKR